MNAQMTQEEWLCNYIEQGFAEVQLGGSMNIHTAMSLAEYGDPREDELAKYAETKHWNRIPASVFHGRAQGLCFLDATGFRFYAPAIMTLIVRREIAVDDWVCRFFLSGLQVTIHGVIQGVAFHELFTPQQRAVIIRFLKYLIHHRRRECLGEPERVLERIRART